MCCVVVYGMGQLGSEIMYGLTKKPLNFYYHSYGGQSTRGYRFKFKNSEHTVDVVNSVLLRNHDEKFKLIREVSCIIVTLTGEQLEQEIDFLLELRIPLVICSTNYDQEMLRSKAENECVSVVMSDNFALPILDFWQKIEALESPPEGFTPRIHVTESHQSTKLDYSASAIKAMSLFAKKGFLVDMPNLSDFKPKSITVSGSMISLRSREDAIKYSQVPEKFLDSHAYHRYFINYDTNGDQEYIDYVFYFLHYFESLVDNSVPDVLEFKVELVRNGIDIVHNVNGKSIYADGVFKAIEYLKFNKGQFFGLDILTV